jgi:hypothetical protein
MARIEVAQFFRRGLPDWVMHAVHAIGAQRRHPRHSMESP